MSILPFPPQWAVTRRDERNRPLCTFTLVEGVRLQVYRHIARPGAWTAYAPGILGDVILAADDLDAARAEALALLERAQTPLGAGDEAPEVPRS